MPLNGYKKIIEPIAVNVAGHVSFVQYEIRPYRIVYK